MNKNSESVFMPSFVDADFAHVCMDDSMLNARIMNGDVVYIKSGIELQNGDIVAARVFGRVILRKAYLFPDKRVVLRACNPLHCDLTFSETDDMEILGKAVAFTSALNVMENTNYPEDNKILSGLLDED